MLYSEFNRVVKRENRALASQGLIIQAAAGSIMAGGEHFDKVIRNLTDG